MVHSTTTIIDANDEEREVMLNKQESSHEYDWIFGDALSEETQKTSYAFVIYFDDYVFVIMSNFVVL